MFLIITSYSMRTFIKNSLVHLMSTTASCILTRQICLTVPCMHSNAQLFPTTACTDLKHRQNQWKMKSTLKHFSPVQAFIGLRPWRGWEWQSSCNNYVWKTKQVWSGKQPVKVHFSLFTSHGPLRTQVILLVHAFTEVWLDVLANQLNWSRALMRLHWLINTGWTRLHLRKRSRKYTKFKR